MSLVKEFRDFAVRGNVVDLAVGVVIGAAFGKIVSSFVNDILTPSIGMLLGNIDFTNLFINLSGERVATLAEAQAANIPVISYGVFINTVVDFLIQAFVIFINHKKDEPAAPCAARSRALAAEAMPLLQINDRRGSGPLPLLHLAALSVAPSR